MTDLVPPRRALRVVADLDVHLGDDPGRVAHLGDEAGALVLDVDQPAELRRSVRVRSLRGPAPAWLPAGLLADTPVRLRCAGRDLATVRLGRRDRLRVRPTRAGVALLVRLTLSGRRRVLVGLVGGLGAAGAIAATHRAIARRRDPAS